MKKHKSIFLFLKQVSTCGYENSIPYLKLKNGIILLGKRQKLSKEYENVFNENEELFLNSNISKEFKNCFFDVFNSFYLENCSRSIQRSKHVDIKKKVIDVGIRGGILRLKSLKI